jgi:hypothetical protein
MLESYFFVHFANTFSARSMQAISQCTPPHCRVYVKIISVVAIFITSRNLVNSLSNHLLESMFLMRGGPFGYQMVASALGDVESIVNFPHLKEPRIRRNLGFVEINENGPVEIRLYRLSLQHY